MGEQHRQDMTVTTWHIIAGIPRPFLESGLEGISALGGSRILDVDTHSKLVFLFVFFNTSCLCCCVTLDSVLLGCKTCVLLILVF